MADAKKLALGLDDIIRLNRNNRRGGGGGGRGNRGFRSRGGGGVPRTSKPQGAGRWRHDLYENTPDRNRGGQRNAGVNSTTKLLISNLDFGVTTSDIEELFSDVGAVRVARVHYDENGRSLGTAEVVFERRVDAVAAQQKYNTLNLDGRPMDIKLVGGADGGSQLQSNRFSQSNGNGARNQRFNNRNNNNQQNGNRRDRIRGGKQQNTSNGKKEEVTADDLDAELDAYRAESKQKK